MIGERRPVVTVYLRGDQSSLHVGRTNAPTSEITVHFTAPGPHGPQAMGEVDERRDSGVELARELGTSVGLIDLNLIDEVRAARREQGLPVFEPTFVEDPEVSDPQLDL
jgi:hypothetical protein